MTRKLVILVGALALSMAAISTAAAQAPAGSGSADSPYFAPPGQTPLFQESASEPETTTKWYGWQIIAVDLASMAAAEQTGGIGILLGSPIVHAANGESGKAMKALALRTGLPLLGFFAGVVAFEGDCNDSYDDGDCSLNALFGGLLGATIGMLTAIVVDVAYLANKEVPVKRERPRYSKVFEHYQPTVKLVDKGAAVGLQGSF